MAFGRIPLVQRGQRPPNQPAQPAAPKTTYLSDSHILLLARNPNVVRKLPFFQLAAAAQKGCKCGRPAAARAMDAREIARVRKSLFSAPPEAIGFLKSVLHVDQLIVYEQTPQGVQKRVF